MMGVAVRTIDRVDPDIVRALAAQGTATVHEAQGRSGLMKPWMRAIVPGASVGGTAVTALCAPGDNWMLHVAIELMRPGDVLVVAATSDCTDGYFGDVLAEFVKSRGGVGAVLDTGVRDVAVLRAEGFPVWARAVSAQGTVKESVGSANVPILCGGVRVVPGDAVVGDDDGVVVVPRRDAASVLDAAEARAHKEELMREKLRAGGNTLDLLGLRDKLVDRGLRYVDGPVDGRTGDLAQPDSS